MPPTIARIPLVITAGLLALVLWWPRVRSGPTGARLVVEVGMATLVLAAMLYGLLVAAQHLPR